MDVSLLQEMKVILVAGSILSSASTDPPAATFPEQRKRFTSWVDHCIVPFTGQPETVVYKLHLLKNVAAELLAGHSSRDHIREICMDFQLVSRAIQGVGLEL